MSRIRGVPEFLSALFGFRGRIGRPRYWLLIGASTLLCGAVCALAMLSGAKSAGGPDAATLAILFATIGAWKWTLLAAMARRLHDLDQPGWWAIPLLLVLLFAVLVLGCLSGRRGANRYGADPLASTALGLAKQLNSLHVQPMSWNRLGAEWLSAQLKKWRNVMPLLIPVLIGIPVVLGGGWVIYHFVH